MIIIKKYLLVFVDDNIVAGRIFATNIKPNKNILLWVLRFWNDVKRCHEVWDQLLRNIYFVLIMDISVVDMVCYEVDTRRVCF
jgi:hypothetical protein